MQIRERTAFSSARVSPVRPGDVIDGKYQIEAELGEGGMGRVLAASHMTIGSTVAIKLLKTEALKYPEVPRRFMREARAAGRLRSEHVVRVTDVGQLATGEPYMVMEMLHGVDLSTRLKQGGVPPAHAVEYIVQACEGLAEAHAMGMVHRDVKPANLFLTQRPNGAALIKLLDFGIATAATGDVDHNLTSTLTVIGSPSYMSPEQLRAARDVDPRSDIWSLGVTLYELLTGEQPFVGPTLTALTLKIVGEPHAPIHGIPLELSAIVDRCLHKEREQRFANVAQLAEALAPFSPNGRIAADMVAGSLSQGSAPTLLGMESSSRMGVPASGSAGHRAAAHKSGPVGYPAQPSGSAGYPAHQSGPAGYPSVPARGPTPPPYQRTPTTTTDLTAGESAPMKSRSRRGAWIAISSAVAVGAIAVTVAVVMTSRDRPGTSPSNAPQVVTPSADPPPSPIARPPEPIAKPAEPAPAPEPEPMAAKPAPEPAEPEPKTAPEPKTVIEPKVVEKPPRVKPPRKRPHPIKTITPPVKDPPKVPVVDPPVKDPPVKDPPVKDPPKKVPCAPNDPRCGL
jgi:eukaryotic-like serine/threonine-protein kinase